MRCSLAKLGACLLVVAPLSCCGTPGAPLPPELELPKPVVDLRAVRKGDHVYLSWTVPTKTTEHANVRYLGGTRVCRSLSTITNCRNPIGELAPSKRPMPAAKNAASLSSQAGYADKLPENLQEQNPAGEITYAVAVFNESGRSAGFSNQVKVPAAPTLPPPADFRAQPSANGVILSWTGIPEPSGNGAIRHAYRIFRREEGSIKDVSFPEMFLGASSEPLQLIDHSLEWEKTYLYRATIATEIKTGTRQECPPGVEPEPGSSTCASYASVEGEDSPAVRIYAHDVFAPAVPAGLQAVASGVGQAPFIDLIWSPDNDADLAGYNIYRREEESQPLKINSEVVNPPAFRDTNVQSGRRYFYSVSAVDLRGNESARSQEASETMP
jgi:hypothetical protein